jgi:glycine hydroxymethyltransferase
MKERDMEVIAEIIQTIIDNPEKIDEVSQMVKNLCKNFKLYE